MWAVIIIDLLILAPAAFLFVKLAYRKDVSHETLTGVFLWTAIMLFMQWHGRNELSGDHDKVCKQLEVLLSPKHPDEQYGEYMPHECDKYTAEYAEGAMETRNAGR